MNSLLHRAKQRAQSVDSPDTDMLRARIMEVVDEALDRVESAYIAASDLVADAPTASEAARRMRRSRAVESASAVVAAGLPIATKALRSRGARRSAKVAPFVLRRHPVVFGASLLGAAVIGAVAMKRRHDNRSGASDSASPFDEELDSDSGAYDLDLEVTRMEAEGGEPSGGSASSGDSVATSGGVTRRRFVRSSFDSTVGS